MASWDVVDRAGTTDSNRWYGSRSSIVAERATWQDKTFWRSFCLGVPAWGSVQESIRVVKVRMLARGNASTR